jgi:hypothetical protein
VVVALGTLATQFSTVLKKIIIKNYRVFEDFALEFAPGLNILVGDNESVAVRWRMSFRRT